MATSIKKPMLGRKKQLEQDLAHITQEMYRRNKELNDTNRTLSLLRSIDNLVLASHEPLKELSPKLAQAITELTEYTFAAIMAVEPHPSTRLVVFGASSKKAAASEDVTASLKNVWVSPKSKWFGLPQKRTLALIDKVGSHKLAKILNTKQEEVDIILGQIGVKTVYAVKLEARGKLAGLMVVGLNHTIDPEDTETGVALLDRLGEAIGVAVDNKLLFEENQRVVYQLKKTNDKLRELDETKDDFISMASHQLRTPLTSIKGYISMVMEEDAGKISKQQKDMLGQAFFSSQRMVYLIADLLNVSRLKTGKFIIEPIKVNLGEVVPQELGQLKETAASRSLTLTLDCPKDFPEVMLDETKTRQVIMNFVDNAIYYTPAGGHITVKLVDKPTSIELRVEDDGIGVAKSDQAHLFTKFYRAGNARKARPDGTGLGLFMAKKVIIAQGGSLIFESEEGKGSTFGFTFSKSHVAVPKELATPKDPIAATKTVSKPKKAAKTTK